MNELFYNIVSEHFPQYPNQNSSEKENEMPERMSRAIG